MRRLLPALLGASLLFLLPAIASGRPEVRLAGTIVAKSQSAHTTVVRSQARRSTLRIPGSLSRISLGQRVELRSTVLRSVGRGPSRVLATGVTVVHTGPATGGAEDDDEDELEVEGKIVSLAPLKVGTAVCAVPATVSLVGFKVGDFVEMTCDRVGTGWVLRKLKLEDDHGLPGADDDDEDDDDDGDDDDDDGDDDDGEDDDD